MKLAWATDLPLDFLDAAGLEAFTAPLEKSPASAFLIGGGASCSGLGFGDSKAHS